jgi:hypothetical protein
MPTVTPEIGPQASFALLAAVPTWLPVADCCARLGVTRATLDKAICRFGLTVRWRGGLLRPNGQRGQRIRLIELGAAGAALHRLKAHQKPHESPAQRT